jgi:hypothetical protein
MDAHAERSGDSYPESIGDSSKHQNWKICIIKESEGGAPIYKLNIGTKKINILIIGSLIIYPTCDNSVSFGPQCNPLFQKKNKIEKFIDNASQVNKKIIKSMPTIKFCI